MSKEIKKVTEFIKKNKESLPLVLHEVEANEKNTEITGKTIQILQYRTTLFPIDTYYKHVTRMEK